MVTTRVVPARQEPQAARRALLATGLFDHVPSPLLDSLLARAHLRHAEPQARLLDAHSSADYLRVLLSGVAKLHVTSRDGNELILRLLRAGDVFGEAGLLESEEGIAEVSAIEPCQVLLIHRNDLDGLPGQTTLYRRLARLLASRLRLAELHHARMLAADAQQRVVYRLLDLAACFGAPHSAGRYVAVPVRQRDLAAMAGVARETANRALTMLEVAGAVAMTGRRAIMVDPARLRRWLRQD